MQPIQQMFSYDVFLSFRGEDTRKNFTSHLHGALKRHSFDIFHDTVLSRGLIIHPQLLQAIEESRIYVVVFSTNYADSRWCLDELSKMMHCAHMNAQHIVLPIYLDVEQFDVKTQKGSYAEAFTQHETKFNQDTVQKWRKALREAGELPGLHLQKDAKGDEEKLLDQIVEKIRKLLHEPDVHVADLQPVVGIESRVQEVISLLNQGGDDNDDVRIVTVYGPIGIGKTTIAKAIYDHLYINFKAQYSCFLDDVKTVFGQSNGKVILQKQFISNLVQYDESRTFIDSYHQGIRRIEKIINHQKVLLVLDNVDNEEQLKMLGINRALLGHGSRIIVTTRDESVVRWVKPDVMYKPRLLDESESMKALCLNALGQDRPKEGYGELLREAVRWGAGRPGALKDLGEYLRCFQSVQLWRCALKDFMYNSSWSTSLGGTNN